MKAPQPISYKQIVPHGSGKHIPTTKVNVKRSPSGASSNGSAIENESPIIGNDANTLSGLASSTIHTVSSSNGSNTRPVTRIINPCSKNDALIRAFVLRQFLSRSNAFSRDENCFVMALYELGIVSAVYLAMTWEWRCERPLLAVCEEFGLFPVQMEAYYQAMKSNSKTSGEFENFRNFVRRILSVPGADVKRVIEQEKQAREKKKRAKTSPASRVSNGKD